MLSGDEDQSGSEANKGLSESKRMASRFGDLKQFSITSVNWQIYVEQMNFFFMANGITEDMARKAIFLSSCGTDTYTLLKSIATPDDISAESFTFKKAVDLLSKHFCPPPNQIIQRFQFYRRDQKEGESVPEFLAALRKLSQHCEFKDLDAMIRDRLVCGLKDEGLQKRLLANDKLTLHIAQEEAIASEEAQRNLIALKTPANQTEINKIVGSNGPALIGRNWFDELGIRITSSVNKIESKLPIEISDFINVFDDQLGDYKGKPIKLLINGSAQPKFFRYRPVPFALKPRVETSLKKMEEDGVIRQIKFSEWATPIVPVIKPDGTISICGDYKCTVNQVLCKETYPLPTNTEVLATLANCKWFSRMNLDRAYTQVKVDEESARILTINTHRGLFEMTRLPFGISTGVVVYLDDILIGGESIQVMWERTKDVLRRIQDAGLKLKRSKCIFAVNELSFLGFKINQYGVQPTDEKIRAISQAPEPINKQQLQAFLGLITFYDRFFQNKSDLLEPLYRLLKKDARFKWGRQQKSSFDQVRKLLQSENLLVHYSADLPLILSGDASPYGVGAVLAHVMPDGREAPIAFGSRTLQVAEQKYSQLDKEALSIVFGIKKFNQFLSGRQFTILTDHKPLLGLFNPTKPISDHMSPRMLRWSLMLGHTSMK